MKGCKTTAKWQKYQNVIQNIFKKAKKGSKMSSSRHETTTKGWKTITKAYNKTAKITTKELKIATETCKINTEIQNNIK